MTVLIFNTKHQKKKETWDELNNAKLILFTTTDWNNLLQGSMFPRHELACYRSRAWVRCRSRHELACYRSRAWVRYRSRHELVCYRSRACVRYCSRYEQLHVITWLYSRYYVKVASIGSSQNGSPWGSDCNYS